jgi:hypothetical protein
MEKVQTKVLECVGGKSINMEILINNLRGSYVGNSKGEDEGLRVCISK